LPHIKRYYHVLNDELRRSTKQPHLTAIVQAQRFSLSSHIARMPDETVTKILTASPLGELEETTRMPWTTWMN